MGRKPGIFTGEIEHTKRNIHRDVSIQRSLFTKSRKSLINIEVYGHGGSKTCSIFQVCIFMYVWFACVLSSESGFTYMDWGSFLCRNVWIVNCLGFLDVCMYVLGAASAWAWSSKTLSFDGGRPSPCTPPHERAKNVPKRSPGVRFHGGFGRVSFWGFRGPSVHPCISSIFTAVFENARYLPWFSTDPRYLPGGSNCELFRCIGYM